MPTHKITLTRAQVSDLFRHAAELMEKKFENDGEYSYLANFYKYDFSCHALNRAIRDANVSWPDELLIYDEYARMFKPASVGQGDSWFGPSNDDRNDQYRQHRVQALLLSPQARREVWEALKLTFVPLMITLLTVAAFLLLSNFPIQVF